MLLCARLGWNRTRSVFTENHGRLTRSCERFAERRGWANRSTPGMYRRTHCEAEAVSSLARGTPPWLRPVWTRPRLERIGGRVGDDVSSPKRTFFSGSAYITQCTKPLCAMGDNLMKDRRAVPDISPQYRRQAVAAILATGVLRYRSMARKTASSPGQEPPLSSGNCLAPRAKSSPCVPTGSGGYDPRDPEKGQQA